jgi:2-oxoglutarate ferredoxin oxidoreductase subunit alpha
MAGGPQGAGVDTAANIFGKACGYGGLYVFGRREYHSNIKGLHSYFHLRISKTATLANVNDVNLLAAFDAETVVRHLDEVMPGGAVIVDSQQVNQKVLSIPTLPFEYKDQLVAYMKEQNLGETVNDWLSHTKQRNIEVFQVPYLDLITQLSKKLEIPQLSKLTKMINVLTIGISFAMLKYDKDLVEKAIRATFNEKIAEMNVAALNIAYEYTLNNFKGTFNFKLEKQDASESRIFVNGNQAVAMGKVLGGCRVQTYYPITPAADESEYLEAHEILKTSQGNESIIIIQTEDEIAAINSASGACLAGARAATSTSGPGFSLMVEGLSWAGMNEVPVVISYYQRGGAATGLPTRHGQQDLLFAIRAGHGEFPRIVLASGDIKECFYDAAKVFNLAEKYQVPVIHLMDKAMANCSQTYPMFDYSGFKIERGNIVTEQDLEGKDYMRFKLTESGISPRAFLGTKNTVCWYVGDERNEEGHISENPLNRCKMMDKRMSRIMMIDREVPPEEKVNFYGDMNSENIVYSWGSPKGAIIEAIDNLKEEGLNCGFMQIRMIHPLPATKVRSVLEGKKCIIDIEHNYLGQLSIIIKENTGISPTHQILKYTGRPMTVTEVQNALRAVLTGKAVEREVLMFGS